MQSRSVWLLLLLIRGTAVPNRPWHRLQQVVFAIVFAFALRSVGAASVTGNIRQATEDLPPIANARVTLFDPTLSVFHETRTDELGDFEFTDAPIGTFRLGASALSFEYYEIEISVPTDGIEVPVLLGPDEERGSWDVIGNTLPEFFDATDIGIVLPDGRVFYCHDTQDPIVFDPVSGEKSFPAGSPTPQGCMNGTLLGDGRILMVGGQTPSDPGAFRNAIRWVKTYNPSSNIWELLADLQLPVGRWYPGLARLADGSLLAMGGGTAPNAERTSTCERFDLASETWSFTGSMLNPTEFPPCALLHTGEVLATWWPPQLYNPQTGQWRLTGNFNQPNRFWPGHSDHSLVVMADGRALAIGVVSGPDDNAVMGEIYDPLTETWSLTSTPELLRFQTEAVQLPDGRILVAGGETEVDAPPVDDVLGIVRWCDLYEPATDSWRRVSDMIWHREYHAVTLLVPDGRVLTTGGTRIKFQVGPTSADIEAYSPPYLSRGVRPQIVDVSASEMARGCSFAMDIAPATQLTAVVLMGMQTTTHWVAAGIPRRLLLDFSQSNSTITANLPFDNNVLPLGHYMVFAMVDDIPSVARIIKVSERVIGDFNCDDAATLADLPGFTDCIAGPDASPDPLPPTTANECLAAFDANDDADVDFEDFHAIQPVVEPE